MEIRGFAFTSRRLNVESILMDNEARQVLAKKGGDGVRDTCN